MTSVIPDGTHPQLNLLPFVVGADFSDSCIEFVLGPFDHALYDLSLSLERPIIVQVEFYSKNPDNHSLQLRCDLFHLIDLEDISRLNILKTFQRDAAFVTRLHFFHVIFETSEGCHFPIIDYHVVS
jgi:hypothetical protein